MNRFKYLLAVLFTAVLAGVIIVSCKKDDGPDTEAEGKKAGTEMCDCVSSYTAPNPADFADDPAGLQAAFAIYAGQLYECLGVIAPYEKYVEIDVDAYNPQAENPLYSIFDFKDKNFEKGFKSGTEGCMQTFALLFSLFQ
jgi:hypothetical protein